MPTNSAVREMLPPKRLICATQIFALEHLARFAQRQAHQLLAAIAVRHGRHHRADVRRQHVGVDHRVRVAAGEDHQPLDVVAQLAHVARPVVRLQHGHRVLADAALRQAGRLRDLVHEIVDQLGNVLAPLGQRRHADRHHRQAVIEILAEAAVGDLRLEIAAVEETMRTSTDTLAVPPTRWNVWSTSTRRILFCVSRGMSAISSMNSVPPCASSSAPTLRCCGAVRLVDAEQLDLHALRRDGGGVDDDERPARARRQLRGWCARPAPCRSPTGRRSGCGCWSARRFSIAWRSWLIAGDWPIKRGRRPARAA